MTSNLRSARCHNETQAWDFTRSTASCLNCDLYSATTSRIAASVDGSVACRRFSTCELSRVRDPSAERHCPDAVQEVRPAGKRGVTTLPRKAAHSSSDTMPPGFTVPKYR